MSKPCGPLACETTQSTLSGIAQVFPQVLARRRSGNPARVSLHRGPHEAASSLSGISPMLFRTGVAFHFLTKKTADEHILQEDLCSRLESIVIAD
jgi:hypothetical protein